MRHILVLLSSLLISLAALPAAAQPSRSALPREVTDHFFLTSDGVRLHYLEAGPPNGHTLVLVPGWTMPAWIWMPQILGLLATLPRRGLRSARPGRLRRSARGV